MMEIEHTILGCPNLVLTQITTEDTPDQCKWRWFFEIDESDDYFESKEECLIDLTRYFIERVSPVYPSICNDNDGFETDRPYYKRLD